MWSLMFRKYPCEQHLYLPFCRSLTYGCNQFCYFDLKRNNTALYKKLVWNNKYFSWFLAQLLSLMFLDIKSYQCICFLWLFFLIFQLHCSNGQFFLVLVVNYLFYYITIVIIILYVPKISFVSLSSNALFKLILRLWI